MTKTTHDISRRTALGSVLAAALLLGGCSTSDHKEAVSSDISTSTPSSAQSSNVDAKIGTPVSVSIPRIGIQDHAVKGLGLASDGTLSPPKGVIQWFTGRVAPGRTGNAIFAGHVTYNDPDVFYRLDELNVGDTLTVKTSEGKTLTFKVTKHQSIKKTELQTHQDVWGPSSSKNLILVSCDANSGWENSSKQHHENNIVVWTTLVSQS